MKEKLMSFLKEHTTACVCTAAGLLCGLLILTLGFWRTLLLVLFGLLGLWIGRCIEQKKSPLDAIFQLAAKIKKLFK